MKTAVLLLGMVSVALAVTTTTMKHGHSHTTPPMLGGDLDHLIRKEIKALLDEDPNLNVDNCATKCDALFDLVSHAHERLTDQLCHYECSRAVHSHGHGHHAHSTTSVP